MEGYKVAPPPTFEVQDYSGANSGSNSGCNSAPRSVPGSRDRSARSSFDAGTPKYHPSPCRSPSGSGGGGGGGAGVGSSHRPNSHRTHLQVGNPTSIFRLPKHQVKLLKKTASVKQLYNSVLSAIKTIASTRDQDSIVPELTKTFFEKLLRTSDESPKLHVTKVKVKDGTEFGRHFCSEVHAVEVTAKVKTGSLEEVRKYHLIVKSQPQSEEARRLLQPSHTFEKEVQMYGQVFHDMANYVRKESVITLNCKDSEVIDVPRCYYTRWAGDDNIKEDLIILENLYPQGFMFAVGQDSGLNRRHAELVIRELAKFHAISFCMKEGSNANMLEKYAYLNEDSLYRESTADFTKRTITPVMASLAELIRNTPGYECHYDWFVDLARNFHQIQMKSVRAKNEFAVICHGDLWLSNILFKYHRDNNSEDAAAASSQGQGQTGNSGLVPTEVKFIDFQSARFASLATDLVLFLFTSVQVDLRRQMLGELVSLYYTTFLVSVRSLNVSGEIYSMEELLIEIEDHIIYGFLEGIWYLDIVHHGHVPKTTRVDVTGHNEVDNDDEDNDDDDGEDDEDRDDDNEGEGDDDGNNPDLDAEGDEIDFEHVEMINEAEAIGGGEADELLLEDEDEREEAEMKRLESQKDQAEETQEQKDYRAEFFELLDEVLFLLGKTRGCESGIHGHGSSKKRRSLRDTSLRFHGRHHPVATAAAAAASGSESSSSKKNSSSGGGSRRSGSISVAVTSSDDVTDIKHKVSDDVIDAKRLPTATTTRSRKGSWCSPVMPQ